MEDAVGGPQSQLDALPDIVQRSLAAWKYLIERGIEPERIRLSQAGSSEPLFIGTKQDESRAARVEIYLLNDVYEQVQAKNAASHNRFSRRPKRPNLRLQHLKNLRQRQLRKHTAVGIN